LRITGMPLPSIYSVSYRDEIVVYFSVFIDYELTVIGELGVDLGRVLVPEGDVTLIVHGQALLQGLGQYLVVLGIRLGAFCCTSYC
jgi:hypothetical protein